MEKKKKKGMGSHQSAKMEKDEWLTPPWILEALGEFDLDPCAPGTRPWEMALQHYTYNGLDLEWSGRVWCNPPYGNQTGKWLNKLAEHGSGIALIFARTETAMFFEHVWGKAHGVLFIEGRLFFHHASGRRAGNNAGAPSVLVAYGEKERDMLEQCGIKGKFIALR